ncbi:sialidase/neuraminidase family protein [Thermaerobacillus caldiproteolyticus]|uniref:hypothetical protein n=1 Tax=Thermaerobacillus caldiproteolyticus TaxID=247480 RepID=UPI00188C91F1|nr:hypothetical protein [Anoxybacillus caldiproteolyticus]QPA33374.1 hypothetical protein ISX45_19175 [Anoxybacillus caldiproteolyticus]
MTTVIDATVVNQAYDTSGNGGRKFVRLSNGWLVELLYDTTNSRYIFQVTKNNATSHEQLCYVQANTGDSFLSGGSIINKGNKIYAILPFKNSVNNYFIIVYVIDAETQTNVNIYNGNAVLDTVQTALGTTSIAINEAGTELHAAWASKNSTYPNSFNIRYAKGTINADGSVTWGAVEQVTKVNTSGNYFQNPSVLPNGKIVCEYYNGASYFIAIFDKNFANFYFQNTIVNWGNNLIYSGNSYTQSSPSAIFVPQSVNGLANGLIGNAWHGTDSASGGVNYIRFSKSTDGGANWSTPQKLVPGTNPTLTANKNGKLFITYEDNGVTKRIESTDNGDTWSAPITVGNGTNPSSLFDLTLNMSEPLTIRKGTSSVLFSGAWVVTTISVTPGYIGQKTSSDKSNILSYSITTDGTMSTITEKINGTTIATRTNPTSGQQFTVNLSQAQWDAIKYGNAHTLTIEMNGETWVYTFDKLLHANDDILSAVKGVQDLQTHLNAIKAQLGAAIRAKGGTVNDTDAWSAFVSAVNGIPLGKKFAKGTGMTDASNMLTITGLTFLPSVIVIGRVGQTTEGPMASFYRDVNANYYQSGSGYLAVTTKGGYINATGFKLDTQYPNTNMYWIAVE